MWSVCVARVEGRASGGTALLFCVRAVPVRSVQRIARIIRDGYHLVLALSASPLSVTVAERTSAVPTVSRAA